MNAIMNWMNRFLLPIAGKLNNNRYLTVLRNAFLLSLPLTIFGSIAVVIMNLPFLPNLIGANGVTKLQTYLGNAPQATMSIMTLFVVMGIGYYLSKFYEVEAIFGAVVAVASFLIVTPFLTTLADNKTVVTGVIPLDRLGAKGMFVGMIVGFLATEIYRKLVQKNWTIKMPQGVPEAVSRSFASLIPAVVTLTVFLIVNILFQLTSYGNIHDFIFNLVQAPLVGLGSGLIPTLIAIFFIQILWFFGLHGQIIVNSVMDPIWNTLALDNLNKYTHHQPLTHIVTKSFMDIFTVGMGGTGMTLAVIASIFIFAKSRQMRQVAKVGIGPGIFNVNEPIIFGLPIVMNPLILVPWFLAPIVVVIVTYFAMSTGLVPYPTGVTIPWTVPIIINGYLATNSIAGSILQIVNFAIVMIIWIPFLVFIDRMNLKREKSQ